MNSEILKFPFHVFVKILISYSGFSRIGETNLDGFRHASFSSYSATRLALGLLQSRRELGSGGPRSPGAAVPLERGSRSPSR